ncbi:MAG: TonB-dependent siderophore receptor [Pseudomonadota bacterium]
MPRSTPKTAPTSLGALAAGFGLSLMSPTWAQTADDAQVKAMESNLPEVIVNATVNRTPASKQNYQAVTTTAGKGKQALRDIPQSITVVTEKLMEDKNQDTLKAAMHSVTGIAFEAGEGGAIGDLIRLRGFTTRGDIFLDGMRDIAQYNRDTFNQDRIEVLRGSASMLYGRGSTGGIINQVSKRPFLLTEHTVEARVGTDDDYRLQGDFNVKTGEDAALRVNVMKTDAHSSRNGPETHREGIAPTYSWGIGTADEFTVGFYHLSYKDVPDYGMAWLNGRPVDAAAERWYGFASDYQNDSANALTLSHTHRFAGGGELKTQFRDGRYQRDLWATTTSIQPINALSATSCQTPFVSGTSGPRVPAIYGSLQDSTVLCHGNQTRGASDHHRFLQTDYSGKAQWGGLRHELLAGAELTDERSNAFSYTSTSVLKPNDLFGEPGANAAVADTRVKSPATRFTSNTLGVYAQDTLSLTPQWKVLGGLRYDRFNGDYERTAGPLSRTDEVASHRIGLLYQPDASSSYYISEGNSFNASGDLYQFDPSTAKTPPEKSRNFEAGAKWDLFDGDLSVRTSIFRTEKTNERNTDLDQSTGAFLLSGKRHTHGVELEAAGRVSSALEVFGGIALMRGVIDKAGSAGAASVGKETGLTPRVTANLWATYQVSEQWRLGIGADGMSSRVPAAAETSINRAPGYVKADALIEYTQRDYKLKLNLNNLFNKVYVDGVYRGFTVWGPTRGAQLTLSKTF